MGNQPYETRSMRNSLDELEVDFLHGVPVRLPENTKRQILAWHETEKQKYAMAYADEIIGNNQSLFGHGEDWEGSEYQNMLKDEQRELNKTKGGKI